MADALCDQLSGSKGLGVASAGLGGAEIQISPTESDTPLRVKRFTFTIPATGPGSAAGDRIKIAELNVFDRFYAGRIIIPASFGVATTLSMGKIDVNNSSNTDDTHYLAATNAAAAAIVDANANLTEQVGTAPTGAATDTGDTPNPGAPGGGFGNAPIIVTLKIGGTPTAGAQIQGFLSIGSSHA